MKLYTQAPHEQRMCRTDFGVKRHDHNALITENDLCYLTISLYNYCHETLHTDSSWVEDVPYWCQGQKVKGQGYNELYVT